MKYLRLISPEKIASFIAFMYMCLLVYTAASKLRDFGITMMAMSTMPLVGPFFKISAWGIPGIEIVIAIIIFVPKTKLLGMYLGTGLMAAFTLYVTYMMIFYNDLPCTCGGFIQELSWTGHIIFNGVFVIAGLYAIKQFRHGKSTTSENLEIAHA